MEKQKYLLMALLLMLSATVMGQKLTLSGTVLDGELKDVLPNASVALLQQDSTLTTGALTDAKGKYSLTGLKAGQYILRVSYVGFATHYQNLVLTRSDKNKVLGDITLSAETMKDLNVTAALAQVEVKADTFVYNADAYRLPEGSTLEELVRKLPGAEVGEDGSIKINGKTVSRILMKGKELFGEDKEMAMKNLNSKMVEKLKAYDRKSDYSRITGIDDGEEETVLDLTPKRNMGEGWIVNADLAIGNARQDVIPGSRENLDFPKPLYSTMLNVNHFDDNLQFMALFNRNNNNGGIGRWGGWGAGSGVTTNTMTGLNVTWTNNKPEYTAGYFVVGGNVRYSERKSSSMSVSNSETFLTSSASSFQNSFNRNHTLNRSVNADARLEWMPDSMFTLTMRPRFSYSKNNSNGMNESVTFNKDPYEFGLENPLEEYDKDDLFTDEEIRVNSNNSESHSEGTSKNGGLNLQLNRRLQKAGRNLTLNVNGNISTSDNDSYNWSKIIYYQKDNTTLQDRYTLSPSKSWNIDTRLSYTEPITKNLNLQLSYQYQRRFSDNDRSMYNLENLLNDPNLNLTQEDLYDVFVNGITDLNQYVGGMDWRQYTLDAQNSQYATYKENNHNANLMFRYTNKLDNGQELRFNAGVSAQPQHTLMHYAKGSLDTTVTRNIFNWAPRINLRWKISNVSQLRLNYNARMSQPSMTQLMEVTDDSNPLNVSTGNAGLRSSWNNNVRLEYNGYRTETQTSWFINAGYNNTKNSITSATIYDEASGARYTRPMNINGNWGGNVYMDFNTALGSKKYWNISDGLSVNYNYRLGYLSTNAATGTGGFLDPVTGRVDMDKLFGMTALNESATKTTSVGDNLRITYRYTFLDERYSVEFTGNGGFTYNHTRSTSQTGNNIDSWQFNYGGSAVLQFPWSVAFTTNITEQSRRGYADKSMNTNELIWNASLRKSFLKGNAATLSVEWNDILQKRSNVSRAISEFSRSDTYTNNINSYFMVHFIYRLNLMGSREVRMPGMPGGMHGGGFGGGRGGFGGGGFGGGGRF